MYLATPHLGDAGHKNVRARCGWQRYSEHGSLVSSCQSRVLKCSGLDADQVPSLMQMLQREFPHDSALEPMGVLPRSKEALNQSVFSLLREGGQEITEVAQRLAQM